MKTYIFLILTISILFNGCSQLNNSTPQKLTKDTQDLKPENKKLVYKTIRDEIAMYRLEGDKSYEAGHNYDAIVAYEKVNFYEGYNAISKSKINKIKETAKKISIHYYKQLKKDQKDKKKSLYDLNKIMMNNPNYKDSTKLFEKTIQERDVKIFLNDLRNTLRMELINNKNTTKNLIEINKAYLNLIKYDYKHPLAREAKNILRREYQSLIKDAKKSYKKGDLKTAEKKFTTIMSIYKDDTTAKKYILKIRMKKNIQANIKIAQKALQKKEYIKALKLSNKVLEAEPNNEKANTIKLKAQNSCNQIITKLIDNGIKNYEKKDLDRAQANFKEVLKLEPNNNTALIYTKKIQRQLETIKSLKEN